MQSIARSLFLLAQVHQLGTVCFASSGVFFGLALAQTLQVVCGASYGTTGWARRGSFLFGFTSAALLWLLSLDLGLGAGAAVGLWWLWLAVWGFFTY